MFKAVDMDGNGVLDKTEFIRLAKSDQLRLTRRKASQLQQHRIRRTGHNPAAGRRERIWTDGDVCLCSK